MRVASLIVTAGALAALPLVGSAPAWAEGGSQPNSTAYPKAPGGTPASGDAGKPVAPKDDAGAKPGPAGAAGSEGAKSATGTPATTYPGAPTDQPAAGKKP